LNSRYIGETYIVFHFISTVVVRGDMPSLSNVLAEVLSMLVNGVIIKSAYFIKDNEVVACWPPNSLSDEVVELSMWVRPISQYNVVSLYYSNSLSGIYVGLTLGQAVLLMKLSDEVVSNCASLLKVLKALSSFSERVNLIIKSNSVVNTS